MRVFIPIALIMVLLVGGCAPAVSSPTVLGTLDPTWTLAAEAMPTQSALMSSAQPQTEVLPLVVTPTVVIAEQTALTVPTDTATIAPLQMEIVESPSVPLSSGVTQPEACQRPQGWIVYTVRANDTLYSLAQRTGTTTQQIQSVNCLNGTLILAGQSLYLPFVPPTQIVSAPTSSSGSGSPSVPVTTPKTGLPGDHLVVVDPPAGPPGTTFKLSVDEYASNEEVIVTIVSVDTLNAVVELRLITDDDGRLVWFYTSPADATPGDYNIFENGTQSNATGKGSLTITSP